MPAPELDASQRAMPGIVLHSPELGLVRGKVKCVEKFLAVALLALLLVVGLTIGFMKALLLSAMIATTLMFSMFFVVASSRDGH